LDKTLIYANDLRLYSEEIAITGGQIGNFPQDYTHLAQIDTALTLNSKLQRR
jgi:GH15 family glucan-1,4-alpha-glucosidase